MSPDRRTGRWVVAVIIVGGLLSLPSLLGGPDLDGMSCHQLDVEALTNGGPYATRDYDADRAREINRARTAKGCDR